MLIRKMPREIKNIDNPCFSCPIEQEDCRKLRFLRLTRSEYMRHFTQHRERLTVQDYNETCIVSSNEGQTCPHWVNYKCYIYTDRPVECRLFPYTLGRIQKDDNRVKINYHDRTLCPHKKELLMPEKEAKKLILSFAHEAFGNECTVVIKRESLLTKWMIKLKHRLLL